MKYMITIRPKTGANEEYQFMLNARPSIPKDADGKTIKDLIAKAYTGSKGFDFFIRAASKIKDNARELAKNAEGTAMEEEFGAAYMEISGSIGHSVEVLKRALQTLNKLGENMVYGVEISEVSNDTASHQSR